MAKNSQARIRANAKYSSKTYSALTLRYRKDDDIFPLLEKAIQERRTSKAEYTRRALFSQFQRDGIISDVPWQTVDQSNDEATGE